MTLSSERSIILKSVNAAVNSVAGHILLGYTETPQHAPNPLNIAMTFEEKNIVMRSGA